MDQFTKKPIADKQQPSTPFLEWSFAIAGALIVGALIVFNIFGALESNGSPPDIQIEVLQHSKLSRAYLVQIKAFNAGGSSAAGLQLEGVLSKDGKEVETSQVTLDYLPPHSSKEGGLFFTANPQEFDLKMRALGYQVP